MKQVLPNIFRRKAKEYSTNLFTIETSDRKRYPNVLLQKTDWSFDHIVEIPTSLIVDLFPSE